MRSSSGNSELRGAARPDPGRAQSHTRKGPGQPLARAGGPGAAPELLGAASPPEPGKAARRGLRTAGRAASARFLPSTFPAPWLPGVVHARGRGGAGVSVTHLRTGSRKPRNAVQTRKAPEAAADQLPNSRSCASGAAIGELPSFPSFKPPANGGAKPREPACSRLPRGPPGRPRRKSPRTRTRTAARQLPRRAHYFSHCGSELALYLAQQAHCAGRETEVQNGEDFCPEP